MWLIEHKVKYKKWYRRFVFPNKSKLKAYQSANLIPVNCNNKIENVNDNFRKYNGGCIKSVKQYHYKILNITTSLFSKKKKKIYHNFTSQIHISMNLIP